MRIPVCMGLLFCCGCLLFANACLAETEWDEHDDPTGNIRIGGTGDLWAHCDDDSEYVTIEVYDCNDRDKCDGEYLEGNFYWKARFDGGSTGYCDPEEHALTTKWFADANGTTDGVTAALIDDPNGPSVEHGVDDTNEPEISLLPEDRPGGFKVKVLLSVSGEFYCSAELDEDGNGCGASGYANGVTWQHGWWSNWIQVTGDSDVVEKTGQLDKGITITATFKAVPGQAILRRPIQAKLKYEPSASWEYNFEDDDWDDGSEYFGVTIPVLGTISYTWYLPDHDEGSFAGLWVYESNGGVGTDRRSTNPDFKDTTSNYSESAIPFSTAKRKDLYAADMIKETGDGYTERGHDGQAISEYTISAGVVALWNDPCNWSKARVKFNNSFFSI